MLAARLQWNRRVGRSHTRTRCSGSSAERGRSIVAVSVMAALAGGGRRGVRGLELIEVVRFGGGDQPGRLGDEPVVLLLEAGLLGPDFGLGSAQDVLRACAESRGR